MSCSRASGLGPVSARSAAAAADSSALLTVPTARITCGKGGDPGRRQRRQQLRQLVVASHAEKPAFDNTGGCRLSCNLNSDTELQRRTPGVELSRCWKTSTSPMSCGCKTVEPATSSPPPPPPWTAQRRRAVFQQQRVVAVTPTVSSASSAPTLAVTPATPLTSDGAPAVVVSDYSGGGGRLGAGKLAASWDYHWSSAPSVDWDDEDEEPPRRLSSCSSCSTVSSLGHGFASRRGSLLDLEAEGLVLWPDGRLEQDPDVEPSHRRRSAKCLQRQRSLDPAWPRWPDAPLLLSTATTMTAQQRQRRPRRSLDLRAGERALAAVYHDDRGHFLADGGRRHHYDHVDDGDDDAMRRTLTMASASEVTAGVGEALRRGSSCTCSVLTREDEEALTARLVCEHGREADQLSQWRKVRGAVQWTPFVQTYHKQKYLWVQLAGHQGNFRAGDEGVIQKRVCGREKICLQQLMSDPLRPFVPEYHGTTEVEDGQQFLQLQDLLAEFDEPCVMDCKIGVRTYQEDELAKAKEKPKLRKDMYEKMLLVDRSAPTEEEHRRTAITKPRYMVWRETISSTATLGFRIEGIRRADGFSSKEFKTTRTRDQIHQAITMFTRGYPGAAAQYLARLEQIRLALDQSPFFKMHEFIGSSLLFVHDTTHASVWMIDFAKTTSLPPGVAIDHRRGWRPGNHEDGYLTGVENLTSILRQMAATARPSDF